MGKELTNFFNHFIQGNVGEGTQRALMLQTVTPLNKGTRKATTLGLRGDVSQSCLRRSRPCRSSEPRKGVRTDAVRSRTEGSTGITLERHPSGDQNKMKRCCGSIRLQLGIQPRGPHEDSVSHSPPVPAPSTLFLQQPFALNLVRKEDGGTMLVPSNDGLTQGCPASPAAFSFLISVGGGILLVRARSSSERRSKSGHRLVRLPRRSHAGH